MKHTILSLIIACIAGLTCSAKSFYYDGVGFEYGKEWKISSSPNGIIGVNDEFRIYISKSVIDFKATNNRNNNFTVSELEKRVEDIMEQSMRLRDKKLLYKSDILTGDINGIPVNYVDFKYSHKEYRRYYCFEWNGYLFDIELCGKGGSFYKEFEKILSSFTFNPEIRSSRW
ncbi:MAG: hypothetical protein E7117_09955 [Bacteroidales bacterium]|nr:hypothetical protein [Bacteroidales bacterium]